MIFLSPFRQGWAAGARGMTVGATAKGPEVSLWVRNGDNGRGSRSRKVTETMTKNREKKSRLSTAERTVRRRPS